jgi:hypothetical protein
MRWELRIESRSEEEMRRLREALEGSHTFEPGDVRAVPDPTPREGADI